MIFKKVLLQKREAIEKNEWNKNELYTNKKASPLERLGSPYGNRTYLILNGLQV